MSNLIESYKIENSQIEIFSNQDGVDVEPVKEIIAAVLTRIRPAFRIEASWMCQFEEWTIKFRWNVVGQSVRYGRVISIHELRSTYPLILAGEIVFDIGQSFRDCVRKIDQEPLIFAPVYPPLGSGLMPVFAEFRLAAPRAFPYIIRGLDDGFSRSSPEGEYEGLGLKSCSFNAKSKYIRCTPNPDGPCTGCKHFEKLS